jgi:urease accessory protein
MQGWQGNLDLTFDYDGNTTRLVQERMQAPLKVQRAFYPEGRQICHVVMLHTAGGVVGGDRLSTCLTLHPHAQVLVTTAAASKLYRSNGLEAGQTIEVNLAAGSSLEWLPQETIVFNEAQYRQSLRINLAPGASWIGWEINRFGRTARNEQFLAGIWRSHTEVWQTGQPLWIDRQWLPGNQETFYSIHGLAGCAIVGSLAYLGQPVPSELVSKARQLWMGTGDMGVTRLPLGMLCRYRGHSSTEVRRWFTAVWSLIRQQTLQREAYPCRVWQL